MSAELNGVTMLSGTIPGGEQVQRKEAHGGNLAKTSLTPMIAVLTAVKKIAGMSGNKERHHPEPMMTVSRAGFIME